MRRISDSKEHWIETWVNLGKEKHYNGGTPVSTVYTHSNYIAHKMP